MSLFPITIKSFGQSAIIIGWPNKVSEAILTDIVGFQAVLKAKMDKCWVQVPAYNSLTLICEASDFDFDQVKIDILKWYENFDKHVKLQRNLWKIPVCYDLDFGLDLQETANQLQLSITELIKRHTSPRYTVYGIGFLPGFMYLGGLPHQLEIKRKTTPRLHVPKGSVGLAGKQTGIYPQDSPGGWNIIGKCPMPLFNLKLENPCFVAVGDQVQFYAINRAAFNLKIIEAEVGISQPEKASSDA